LQTLVNHEHLKLAYLLSSGLAVAALVASAVGVFYPGLFRDTAMTAGNAEGTDLVILAVALPALLISMLLTARGSIGAQIVWLGALSYLLYNAAFNQMFLLLLTLVALPLTAGTPAAPRVAAIAPSSSLVLDMA
jgi:hypothetical protein